MTSPHETILCDVPLLSKIRTSTIMMVIKGIRDAGSTADFRIRFEMLKFKNLEIRKFENLEKFGTFGKF